MFPTLVNTFRYCHSCGAQSVRTTRNAVQCDACDSTLYVNIAVATGVIIQNERKEVLLLTRAQDPYAGMWDVPGGFVEADESAEEGMRREVREEIGAEVEDVRYLGSFPNVYPYKGVQYDVLDIFFTGHIHQEITVQQEEVSAWQWVPITDVDPARIAFSSAQKAIEIVRSQHI